MVWTTISYYLLRLSPSNVRLQELPTSLLISLYHVHTFANKSLLNFFKLLWFECAICFLEMLLYKTFLFYRGSGNCYLRCKRLKTVWCIRKIMGFKVEEHWVSWVIHSFGRCCSVLLVVVEILETQPIPQEPSSSPTLVGAGNHFSKYHGTPPFPHHHHNQYDQAGSTTAYFGMQ